MPSLYIYIIHSKNLTKRLNKINGTIQKFKEPFEKADYNIIVKYIENHEASEIQSKLSEYQDKVNYEMIGDSDFDNQRKVFTVEMISNFEKHKEAWRQIIDTDYEPKDRFLILEDDTFVLPESLNDIYSLSACINKQKWDMIILGLSKTTKLDFQLLPIKNVTKVLPSKEGYFISPSCARSALESFNEYRFTFRVQLSYWIYKNPSMIVLHPTKRITVDGSKLGLYSSSIHVDNVLLFNHEYMMVRSYLDKNIDKIEKDMENINRMILSIMSIKSPDIHILYGKIMIKLNRKKEALEHLMYAIELQKENQGILNNRSEVANLIVDLHSDIQSDLEVLELPSKYSKI